MASRSNHRQKYAKLFGEQAGARSTLVSPVLCDSSPFLEDDALTPLAGLEPNAVTNGQTYIRCIYTASQTLAGKWPVYEGHYLLKKLDNL